MWLRKSAFSASSMTLAARPCADTGDHAMVLIADRGPLVILQVSAFARSAGLVAGVLAQLLGLESPAPNRYCGDLVKSIRMVGPCVWQIIGDPAHVVQAASLRAAVAEHATVVDLAHARTVMLLGGAAARRTLAKHCSLDLADKQFPTGCATLTRFGHLGIGLARVDDSPQFELMVARGYAESLLESLVDSAREFGGIGVVANLTPHRAGRSSANATAP